MGSPRTPTRIGLALLLAAGLGAAWGQTPSYLSGIRRHRLLTSTTPDNGDTNPYAVVVAPVSAGDLVKGDVLVDNFNAFTNFQGTGSTIVRFRPGDHSLALFAKLPALPQCPGGIGLTTAMTMLESGWILVGSAPSQRGSTATKGPSAIFVLDPRGQLAAVWTGPEIDGPWGNIAVLDQGDRATLFITMAGSGLGSPKDIDPRTGLPPVLHNGTVLRLELRIPAGQPPVRVAQTVIADGLAQRADQAKFLLGPTGLALGADHTLYISDGVENCLRAVGDALTRSTSAGPGRIVTRDGLLNRPLAMAMAPNGHLLVCNGCNGQVVEVDPGNGQQVAAQWLDSNQAQTPPGNGDLFGLALALDGQGFYYVQDDTNLLLYAGR